jgi:hypothetical protein
MMLQAHHGAMHIAPHIFSSITRTTLIGALAADPVLPERRRRRGVPLV